MSGLGYLFLVLFGLAVGSFLNVVIVRLPDDQSLLRPPSRCPQCEHELAWKDNIPVLGWVMLRGKCRYCAQPIPAGYPMVEIGNAALWCAAGWRFGPEWILLPYLFLFSVLLAQTVIDLELYLLLDKITFPALAVSVVALPLACFASLDAPGEAVAGAFIGAVVYFLFLFIPALIYPKGMGLGDVKLAALMGLYLGAIHPMLPLMSLIAACVLGIVVGGVLYFVRGRKSMEFPFGPWLAAGCVLAVLFSSSFLPDVALNIP